MAQFRTKPELVEAVRWKGETPLPEGCFYGQGEHFDLAVCFIDAPDGAIRVEVGDWIVTTAKGRHKCVPDIFEATYDVLSELHGDGGVTVDYADQVASGTGGAGFKARCGKCGQMVMRVTCGECQPVTD